MLYALAGTPFVFADIARSAGRTRMIALDWGAAETLIALGFPPVGAAEIAHYNRSVVSPAMPEEVIDVGLRLMPNPELMQALSPDIILINAAQEYMRGVLEPFGKVISVPIYTGQGLPYERARAAALRLAGLAGCASSGTKLVARTNAAMAAARERLLRYDGAPLCIVAFIDARHVTVFGRNNLFQGVFDRLGLRNAWLGPSNEWGVAVCGIEALAEMPDARLLYVSPVPEEATRTIASSPFWLRLPAVRQKRVTAFPPVWPFGALPSALRMACLLTEILVP